MGKKRVTGIGGIFFKSNDPSFMRDWYSQHLGLNTDQYGTTFEWRHADDPSEKGHTVWSPFERDTKYFQPSKQDFMINFRVTDLEGLLEELKAAGIEQIGEMQTYEYGKFAHIMDPEGNKLELWEPVNEAYDEMVDGKTTK